MSEQVMRATVRGDVIGVGLRAATVARARELGVRGWVRHAEDDDTAVAVHAEGEAEAVDALAAFLAEGGREVERAATRVKVEGHEQFAIRGVSAGPFAVTERAGGGYELRLEVDGADRVWHLSKAPSMVPADKRMAIGAAAPDAEPGAPWDAGTYEQGGRVPWPAAIDDRGHAVFVLHGDRLRGGFALQRTRGPQWLLIKRRDAYADAPSTPR